MTKITAAEVNRLRLATGIGMMDCKHALVEAEGDFDKAIDILRKKGQKVAAKRADRLSNEGRVIAKTNAANNFGAILAVSCETDFVAKNAEFIATVDAIVDWCIQNKVKTKDELTAQVINGRTVSELLLDLTGKTGEKIELSDFQTLEAPTVDAYNHIGNKLGTIVGFNMEGEKIQTVAHEIAMQIAAMNPLALDSSSIPQETLNHELELARDMARQEGKPEQMIEKIAQGKLNKFLKENTLLSQDYIDNNKISVGDYIKQTDPKLACTAFFRLQVGA
ncbi:MAG TPA: translation elongation factor Ts [Bacteroidales bacterium]|jgi:elongation factor Ts|nr:translation elongation factor Ts [Bacteroidales bacterium]HOS58163.1 translation elongation factor Ts [Bacteroidales bacterium]HPY80538.1 translation elongation factor Ts [Bacteroidales bacterium]HQA86137.1 translation elongation factor Ts [Bacteroidales bacterium]